MENLMAITFSALGGARSTENDFVVGIGNTSNNTATLSSPKPAGVYNIFIGSPSYDIYLIASNGASVGYSSGQNITASAEFDTVVILGGSADDIVSFVYSGSYGTATTTSSAGQETGAGAYVTSASPTNVFAVDSTTTLTGGNFATDVEVYFLNTAGTLFPAKNIVRNTSTELVVTRPDGLSLDSSYGIKVVNPGLALPVGSGLNSLASAVSTPVPAPAGGTITSLSDYVYHAFTSSGTFTLAGPKSVEYVVVGGGGGGGRGWSPSGGGGGGAGGLLAGSVSLGAASYSITVGAGGNPGLENSVHSTNGGNSSIGALAIAIGGGAGASGSQTTAAIGGSGGAGSGTYPNGYNGTAGQGFKGGDASSGRFGGGGGGAAEVGGTATTGQPGDGGNGLNTYSGWASATSTGDSGFYAGGGAGGKHTSGSTDGVGGNGGGGNSTGGNGNGAPPAQSGAVNTGGGGAAGNGDFGEGGFGGSGIVIVRYAV
jgi:hypothetical protein